MFRITSQSKVRIGVVGYSAQKFDTHKAKDLIIDAFNEVELKHPSAKIECVSGLTNLGIPALAYQEAKERNWKTVGVACEKAKEYDLFPVDKQIIIGENWGDESDTFLSMIDVLVRIGGGKQSLKETKMAKESGIEVIEHELDTLTS